MRPLRYHQLVLNQKINEMRPPECMKLRNIAIRKNFLSESYTSFNRDGCEGPIGETDKKI